MSLRLLGNSRRICAVVGISVGLFFSATLSFAQGVDESRSGVVAPKITKVKPLKAASGPDMVRYQLPKKYSMPFGVAVDSQDRVWFTEMMNNSLAVLDPATNELKEYRIPSTADLPEVDWEYDPKERSTPEGAYNIYSAGSPGKMIVDGKGMVWMVLHLGNSIARFDPEKEEFTEYIVPTPNAQPYALAEDSKGNIWFVEKNAGQMGRLDFESGKVVEIPVADSSQLMGITIDDEDNVWVGDIAGNYIGRYDPATKEYRTYPLTQHGSQPGDMAFDKNKNLWICNERTKQLGVLMTGTKQGVYSVVNLPGYNAVPHGLVVKDNGRIWVIDSFTNQVGYFDSAGELAWTMFPIPVANSQPMNVAQDSAGNLWFTLSDRHANSVMKLVTSTVPEKKKEAAATANKSGEGADTTSERAAAQPGADKAQLYLSGVIVFIVLFTGLWIIRRFRIK